MIGGVDADGADHFVVEKHLPGLVNSASTQELVANVLSAGVH